MVGFNQHFVIADVHPDVRDETLTAPLQLVGDHVVCPVCGSARPMKEHAAEHSWRHLDAMPFERILTAKGSSLLMGEIRSDDNFRVMGR